MQVTKKLGQVEEMLALEASVGMEASAAAKVLEQGSKAGRGTVKAPKLISTGLTAEQL